MEWETFLSFFNPWSFPFFSYPESLFTLWRTDVKFLLSKVEQRGYDKIILRAWLNGTCERYLYIVYICIHIRDIYDIFTVSGVMTILVIYLFTSGCSGSSLLCMHGLSLVVASRGYSPAVVCRHLTVVASFLLREALVLSTSSRVWAQQLQHMGPYCPVTDGTFPDQGSNLSPLH